MSKRMRFSLSLSELGSDRIVTDEELEWAEGDLDRDRVGGTCWAARSSTGVCGECTGADAVNSSGGVLGIRGRGEDGVRGTSSSWSARFFEMALQKRKWSAYDPWHLSASPHLHTYNILPTSVNHTWYRGLMLTKLCFSLFSGNRLQYWKQRTENTRICDTVITPVGISSILSWTFWLILNQWMNILDSCILESIVKWICLTHAFLKTLWDCIEDRDACYWQSECIRHCNTYNRMALWGVNSISHLRCNKHVIMTNVSNWYQCTCSWIITRAKWRLSTAGLILKTICGFSYQHSMSQCPNVLYSPLGLWRKKT